MKNCEVCGKEFETFYSSKTCSEECKKERMRRYHRKYKRHEREERKADKCGIKKCEICGKEFPVTDFYKKEKGKIC